MWDPGCEWELWRGMLQAQLAEPRKKGVALQRNKTWLQVSEKRGELREGFCFP